jgi:GT2 family glycosyltransferase
MNIAVILLTQNRADLTKKVIDQNFYNSGYDADCFLIDTGSEESQFYEIEDYYNWKYCYWSLHKMGIAAGVNTGFSLTTEYDGVCILANDILLPDNWLSNWVMFSKRVSKTGIIGIHCVENLPPLVDGIHKTHTPFGNNYITRELIDTIGGYNKEYDPYGMQDRDYAERATIAGFTNYYLPDLRSEHIGHDVGNNTEYRRMKDESLARAQAVWEKYQPIYHEEKNIYAHFSNNK